jgi:glycosyltransferase involved in cell wall biosynthesis
VVTDHGLGGGGAWLFERFACVSRYSARVLGVPSQRTRIIYGGVDAARFAPHPDDPRQGALFVGRITPHKGIDVLIRALPEGVPLTVAGTAGHDARAPESNYPQLLRRLARDRPVTFAGRVPELHLPALYRRASVFVLPSVHETCYGRWIAVSELLGLSLLEAMASATPVVCSRVGGLDEVVSQGETGYLVEPGNVEELRARISSIASDHALARRLGQAGRERAIELFSWEACAARCLDVYTELDRR